MATTKAGSIEVEVRANAKTLKNDLKKAEAQTQQSAKKMADGMRLFDRSILAANFNVKKFGTGIKKFATEGASNLQGMAASANQLKAGVTGVAAVVGGLLVGGLVNMSKQAVRSANDLGDIADKLGVNATTLQEFQFAAGQVGVKVETLNMGLQRFGRRAAEAAEGTGEAKGAIAELGLQLTDAGGRMRSTEDLFADAMAALGEIQDPLTKLRLAFKLFDSEGAALVNLAGNLGNLREEAHSLGLVISEDLIKKADELQDSFDALAAVTDAQLKPALVNVGGAIVKSFKQDFADFAKGLNLIYRNVVAIENLDLANLKQLEKERSRALEDAENSTGWIDPGPRIQNLTEQLQAVRDQIKKTEAALKAADDRAAGSKVGKVFEVDDPAKISKALDEIKKRRIAAAGDERALLEEAHAQEFARIEASIHGHQNRFDVLSELQRAQAAEMSALDDKLAERREDQQQKEIELAKSAAAKRAGYLDSLRLKALTANGEQIAAEEERLRQQLAGLDELELSTAEHLEAVALLHKEHEAKVTDIKENAEDERLKKLKEERKEWDNLFTFVEDGFADSMATMLLTGEFTFQSLAQSFAREFIQLGLQKTVMPLLMGGLESALGAVGGLLGFGGGVGGADQLAQMTNSGSFLGLGGLSAGQGVMRANGGPVSGPAIVGERGPELFIPGTSGFVANNLELQKMGRGGGGGVNVTVINHSGEKATTTERDGPNGMKEIEVMIGKTVSKSIARGGDVDKAIRNSYGIQRVGRHGV